MRSRSLVCLRSLLVATGAVAAACVHPSDTQHSLEAGTLPATWYAGGADCGGAPRFVVHAYDPDFYILRQPACTNFEKPFLYLVFGRDKALLLDSGAGRVDVVTPVDTLVKAWMARHGRTSMDL